MARCQPATTTSAAPLLAPKMEPLAVTKRDAAQSLGESEKTIERKIASGALKAVKSGRKTLILVHSLREHISSLPPATYRGRAA